MLLQIKGALAGKYITISIITTKCNNYVSTKFTNQISILESNIIEKIDFWDKKQYDINNLPLNIGDYTFVLQFTFKSLWSNDGEIIMGSP
jgi:hypothetical protein